MPLDFTELKGCWLVWYPVSVHGGCTYSRTDPEVETIEKREESIWLTDKIVQDIAEHKGANALRNLVKRRIRKLGAPAAPGIVLVPLEDEEQLDAIRAEMTQKVKDFNADSNFTDVKFRCYKYRIEGENEEVLKEMLNELRETLMELRRAEQAADFKGIRNVIQRLAGFETVLPEDAGDYLQRAVADAKAQAKEIEKSLKEKGVTLKQVKARISTSSVDFARFAVMEPGGTLPEVDNDLVKRMIAAQAAEHAAGIEMSSDDGEETPDFGALASNGDY